jgi:hypothetical protein
MVIEFIVLFLEVFTVKVAVVPPAATVIQAGTVAAEVLLLARVTTAPPLGAAPLSVTVPVEEVPPITEVGIREAEERLAVVLPQDANLSEAMRVFQLKLPPETRYSLVYQNVQSSEASMLILL